MIVDLPTWGEILRVFPLAGLTLLIMGVGYYLGRASYREFIDWLKGKGRDD